MRRHEALNAQVCREIVETEIREGGPISVSEMLAKLALVFRVNHSIFCSAILSRGSGLFVANGVIDIIHRGVSVPLPRHATRHIRKRRHG